ncbi:MAG: hypothetical protein WB565_13290 [Acidimicrobiales bacterium]
MLILTTYGVIEPFGTNGYADPLWSMAAVGAVVFGLLLPLERWALGAAAVLIAVAGETKIEGTITGGAILGLLIARWIWAQRRGTSGIRWTATRWTVFGGGFLLLLAWPALMKVVGTNGGFDLVSPQVSTLPGRAPAIYDAMKMHLYILPLALAVSAIGWLTISRVRRATGVDSDLWAWGALGIGLAVVVGAYLESRGGASTLKLWLETSVHRVSEFPGLMAWWIIAIWTVLAYSALVLALQSSRQQLSRIVTDNSAQGDSVEPQHRNS